VEECKPLPVLRTAEVTTSAAVPLDQYAVDPSASPACMSAATQGLTLVHVRAQLEQLRDTFMS
jgi:hypothetical protein